MRMRKWMIVAAVLKGCVAMPALAQTPLFPGSLYTWPAPAPPLRYSHTQQIGLEVQALENFLGPNGSNLSFKSLSDTPDSYGGQAGKCVKVTSTEDGMDFEPCVTGAGDVTAVGDCASGDCFQSVLQNRFLGSPDGSTGIVSARPLVANDIPSLPTSKITSGTFSLARGGLGFDASGVAKGGLFSGTGAGTVGITTVGTNGFVLTADSSAPGGIAWASVGGSSHNLLSATHPDTTAASVVRGDLITGQTATPKWQRLAIGTTGKYLRSDGTDPSWQTIASGDVPWAAPGTIGSTTPNTGSFSQVTNSGAEFLSGIRSISSNQSANSTDRIILCTGGGGGITYTLPAATATGRRIEVIKVDAGAGACTVSRAGSDTINGATTYIIGIQYKSRSFSDTASTTWQASIGQINLANSNDVVNQLPIANGGTGQAAAAAGFDALAPTTTRGDVITRGASSNGRLALGSNNLYLKSNATDLVYSTLPAAGTGSCTNQFNTSNNADAAPTCTTATLASAQFANQGTTTTVLHGNASGNPSFAGVSFANDAAANQGTTTQVLHGNAAGQPSFGSIATGDIATDAVTRDKVSTVLRTRQFGFMLGAEDGSALVATNDQPEIFFNDLGSGITITKVRCSCDAGAPTINLQRQDGSPANILSSDLTCATFAGGTTTTFSGTENQIADGQAVNLVLVTTATAKRCTISGRYTLD